MLQTMLAGLIGLAALAYLLRRWWPAWQRLWQPAASTASQAHGASDCAQTNSPQGACAVGCGSCGQAQAAPSKDHRVHIVRKRVH